MWSFAQDVARDRSVTSGPISELALLHAVYNSGSWTKNCEAVQMPILLQLQKLPWKGDGGCVVFLADQKIASSWGIQLGDSGGVVNFFDFCPASLKSRGCFYFRCVLSSQWKVVTANLRILHCQLYRHFWRPVVIICLSISNNLLLVLQDAPKCIFSTNSRSSGQSKNDAKTTLFFHPPSPFHGNFCSCNSIGICTA